MESPVSLLNEDNYVQQEESENQREENNNQEAEEEHSLNESQEMKEDTKATSMNGHDQKNNDKRQRKKVQRLSETWNRAHEAKEEERAKAVKAVSESLENATGTALGDIPLIDASIRKVKPVDLKVLHLVVYGRPGTVAEIRSNLRKFRGFSFESGSEQYIKKLAYIQSRSASDLRESLRILNLEVSGTREHLASRLMEFLHTPSAKSVKYKGKLVKKSANRGKPKKDGKTDSKPRTKRSQSSKATSSEASIEEPSHTEDQESDVESSLSNSPAVDTESNQSSESNKVKSSRKQSQLIKLKAGKKRALDDSDEEYKPKGKVLAKKEKKTTKATMGDDVDADEDAPLSALAKGTVPSDNELKKNIIDLLKTVNLEETSLKVVREKIFSLYPNANLTDKKEFINATVKEFLSQS